jgi:ribosomal protein S18 acetylase RimI-like enzyme
MELALASRIEDFEIELDRRATEEVTEHGWGAAFLNPSVLIEQPGLLFAEIEAIADEVIGGAGMNHRTVFVRDQEAAREMRPDAVARGWGVEHTLQMVLREDADREPEVEVREARQAEIEDLRRELITSGLPGAGPVASATVDQLLAWDERLGEIGGDRWFVADYSGEPASACRLLAGDGFGQVEDVGTLERAREQGLARAVTLAAARASVADGNEVTFLGALADDWPRLMYAKLGFEPLRESLVFRRRP